MELTLDPRQPDFRADPHRFLRHLREHDPVHFSPILKARVLTRHADMVRATTQVRELSSDALAVLVGPHAAAMAKNNGQRVGANIAMTDGDVHARLRAAMAPELAPAAVKRLEPFVRRRVDVALEQLARRGTLDVVGELGLPLAEEMIAAHYLGVPDELRRPLQRWAEAATRISDPLLGREERRANFQRLAELVEWLEALVAWHRTHASGGWLARLVGLEGGLLSRGEIVAACMSIIGGGIDTVSMAIAKGVLALIDHPDQRRLLAAHPELEQQATDEILRFCAPALFAARVAREPLRFDARVIEAGALVLYSPAAACRDPAVFRDPDRLDLERRDGERWRGLAFGHGAHFCIGAALARLQCRVVFGELARRFPHVRLAVPRAELQYSADLMSMALLSLPIAAA